MFNWTYLILFSIFLIHDLAHRRFLVGADAAIIALGILSLYGPGMGDKRRAARKWWGAKSQALLDRISRPQPEAGR